MAKNISDVAEFINLYLNAIRPKFEDIQQRYKAIFSNLHLLEAEANNIARASVIKSFEEAYIDPDTDLANAIASCIKVKLTGDFNSGDIKYEIIDEFKNQNMLKTWNLKDGGIGKSKVRTKGIAEMFDQGRSEYTVQPTGDRKYIAIPPPGEEYDPENPDNTILRSATIPARPGSNYIEYVDEDIQDWANRKQIEILEEFLNEINQLLM
jgi:hypothetical protein